MKENLFRLLKTTEQVRGDLQEKCTIFHSVTSANGTKAVAYGEPFVSKFDPYFFHSIMQNFIRWGTRIIRWGTRWYGFSALPDQRFGVLRLLLCIKNGFSLYP